MSGKKGNPRIVDELSHPSLSAFKRGEWFHTAKTIIQIALMAILAVALGVFLTLLFVAGTSSYLPQTPGVVALGQLFVEISENAKAVALFALGFFFREYINGAKLGE